MTSQVFVVTMDIHTIIRIDVSHSNCLTSLYLKMSANYPISSGAGPTYSGVGCKCREIAKQTWTLKAESKHKLN